VIAAPDGGWKTDDEGFVLSFVIVNAELSPAVLPVYLTNPRMPSEVMHHSSFTDWPLVLPLSLVHFSEIPLTLVLELLTS
jgi:hypothetical protein